MKYAKAFQQATVVSALAAFDARRRVRRFLVADEVGLGKTVVASGVVEGLIQRKARGGGGPLRVFYICSSLAIASQNRGSILKILDDPKQRRGAACEVDRLTLAPNSELDAELPLHLYTLTPETSIPDRKGKHRSGGAMERALLHNLLKGKYPELVISPDGDEWLTQRAVTNWSYYKNHRYAKPTPALTLDFFRILRGQLGLEPGRQLPAAMASRIAENPLDTIKLLRIVLAKTGLEHLSPDLVIFDEFQRFSDLLAGEEKGSEIARMMVRSGPEGPAVLLLSATPYRLYGGDFDHVFSDTPHHEEFYDLIEWLLGKDTPAIQSRKELETAFKKYGDGLRSKDPMGPGTLAAKKDIENRLKHVMARTERFSHDDGHEMVELKRLPAPLIMEDLQAFRHVVDCIHGSGKEPRTEGLSSAVPYWSSVPMPMQTMGKQYKAWADAQPMPAPLPALALTRKQRGSFRAPKQWPHPRMRALKAELSPECLSIPWISPSLPWWSLGGPWATNPPRKVLLFSRFRAVPRTIASLLSFDMERHLLAASHIGYEQVTKRTLLGPSRENFAFFHVSRALAQAVDPWRLQGVHPDRLLKRVEEELTRWLGEARIPIRHSGGIPRNFPDLIILLERRTGDWDASFAAWKNLAENLARTTEANGGMSLRSRIDKWDAAVPGELTFLTWKELKILARASISYPGVVLARSLSRHGLDLQLKEGLSQALSVSWEGLRSYLNNPWMNAALTGKEDYRDRIGTAVIQGNLESVLDEHLWVTAALRNLEPSELAKQLEKALGLRTSDMKMHGFDGNDFTLRAHAALAFTQEVRVHRPDRVEIEDPTVRTDDLRIAFNSPFWPHVLTSTSVGQEGLDFHSWCTTIAHWDLPGGPVDLEQREGRINRYAGLSTRRAIAAELELNSSDVAIGKSPWKVLATLAEAHPRNDAAGLAPWWIFNGAKMHRIVFDVPFSEAGPWFEHLRQQRLLYRLALGQPDQEDLVRALRGRLTTEEVRRVVIDLSPWKRSGPTT